MKRESQYPYLRPLFFRPRPPRHTLVFLHIPKTAGLSLRELLLARTAPHPYFRVVRPLEDHQRLETLPRVDRGALGLVEGHLYFGIHEVLPRACVYLTMLREPTERVLSYYSYIREYEPHHLHQRAQGMGLAECFEQKLTIELDNFMVRSLTSLRNLHVPFGGVTREMLAEAKAHLESVAAIGLTEAFEESVAHFCEMFGWKSAVVPRLNGTRKRVRVGELSREDAAAIREHNRLDQELYEFGRDLFRARLGRESRH